MEPSPRTERIGSTVDGLAEGIPYTFESRIGGSGGTEVWVGRDRDGQLAAVKLVRDADRSPLDSFKHELEAARSLDHPAIVRVRDFGESARGLYIAMDLVQPGISLATLIARHTTRRMPLSPAIVAYIGIAVAEALDHAATRAKMDGLTVRLLHRHLSPGNILIDTEGRVRLADLAVPASRVAVSPVSGALIRGTPGYLAPEQVREGVVDERSDVFVLGAILHECATLEPAFARADPNSAMLEVLSKDVRPLSDALSAFPGVLSRAIAKALARDRADRPADSGELKVALREAVPTTPGYSEARAALAGMVAVVLRAINQESEARTALNDAPDGPRTLRVDADGVELPVPDAVTRGSLAKVETHRPAAGKVDAQRASLAKIEALAAAEVSRDSADEPTGALLLPPPGARDDSARAELTPVSSGGMVVDATLDDHDAGSSGPEAAVERSGARTSSPAEPAPGAARPPPLVTPRTPTARTSSSASGAADGSGSPRTRLTGSAVPVTARSPTRPAASSGGWVFALSSVLEDPRRRRPIVISFVVVCLALVAVLIGSRTSSEHDDALRALYARGAYREAEAYYVAHVQDFRYPGPAFELAADAHRRARAEMRPPEEATPPDPATDASSAAAGLPPASPAGSGEVRSLTSFAVPADIPESPARTKAERKARAKARKSRETALRALEIEDMVAAEKALRRCVATFDGPACRLQLGLLHARAGELEEASIHFERYLEAWPAAPDAAEIRAALAALPATPEVE